MFLASRRLALPALIGAVLVLTLAATSAQAGTYDVTHNGDTAKGDANCLPGNCSVRQAVEASNAASESGDVINIPANTYTLQNGRLRIDRTGGDLTINGAGARDTIIDGNANDRVFKIFNSVVTIKNLTIQNGGNRPYGGGIWNRDDSETTLDHVAVKSNTAGYDCGEEFLLLVCGFEAGRGGGIFNGGSLTVLESEISGNVAHNHTYYAEGQTQEGFCYEFNFARGGGVYNEGLLSMTNVTLSDNVAENGLCSYYVIDSQLNDLVETQLPGFGGGLWTAPDLEVALNPAEKPTGATLTNDTVSNNTAGLGGGISTSLIAYLLRGVDVVSDETGGLDVKNTIVANNEATGPDITPTVTSGTDNCQVLKGDINSLGNNLESDTSCNFTGTGDKQNTDPVLGALQNNGGQTNTRALLTGSPAIDMASNDGCPGTDQRDVTRPQNGTCDIGAYEVVVTPPPVEPATTPAAPVQAQAQPTARSSIHGPRACVRSSARIRVRGRNIRTVVYKLNGKRIKKAKGNRTSVKIKARKLRRSRVNRVTARITYTAATAAKPKTRRFTLTRCARRVKPKFTG